MAKKKTATVDPALRQEMITAWEAGVRFPALGRELTERLGKPTAGTVVRQWLIAHYGGQAGYEAAAAKREAEHPRAKPTPPRRPPRKPSAAAQVIDDTDVPAVTSGRYADGWKDHTILIGAFQETVLIAPDGTEYVRAGAAQRADLIAQTSMGPTRWRLFATSTQAKQLKHEEKVLNHHANHKAAKKKQKKITRKR